jgi:hypothetical protein
MADLDDLLRQFTDRINELASRVDDLERQESGAAEMQLGNKAGIQPWIGPFAELIAEGRNDDITVQFQYPFYNTDFDMLPAELTGDGAVSVADGLLQLSSTTGTAYAASRAAVRYRPGHSGFGRFTASFVGAGIGEIGVIDTDTGFGVRVTNGVLSLFYRRAGVDTAITATDGFFNGGTIDVSGIDWTKINIFAIDFGYLGVASPVFWIKRGTWEVLGIIETEGLLTTTHINNPVMPISAYTSGAMVLKTASWNAGVIGNGSPTGARYFQAAIDATLSGTNVSTLGTFRNKTTYKTLSNKVKAKALKYALHVDAPASGSGTVQFIVRKNATLTGTPSWVDIDADSSVIEVDGVATYSSGGRAILTQWVGYAAGAGAAAKIAGDEAALVAEIGLFLYPGETATITAQNVSGSQNVVCRVAWNWIELF